MALPNLSRNFLLDFLSLFGLLQNWVDGRLINLSLLDYLVDLLEVKLWYFLGIY